MKAWVQQRVRQKGYTTASEYVMQLLRHDQLQDARDRVDAKLLQALESGDPKPMTGEDWQAIRSNGRKQAGSLRRAKR